MPPVFAPPAALALHCHPDSADAAVRLLTVTLGREAGGAVLLDWRLDGELAALCIPDATQTLPPERLWAHTCFELFVAACGESAYREFNFSPGGQWMRFDFSDYRQRVASPAGPAPMIAVSRSPGALSMAVRLPAEHLPAGDLAIGLTAVVEHADGSHCYWALSHPAGRPDFHHRDGFAVVLKASTP